MDVMPQSFHRSLGFYVHESLKNVGNLWQLVNLVSGSSPSGSMATSRLPLNSMDVEASI